MSASHAAAEHASQAPAEEMAEDILAEASHLGSSPAALLQTAEPLRVVDAPLLRVGEHLVREGDFLELVARLRVLVRVELLRQTTVRLPTREEQGSETTQRYTSIAELRGRGRRWDVAKLVFLSQRDMKQQCESGSS